MFIRDIGAVLRQQEGEPTGSAPPAEQPSAQPAVQQQQASPQPQQPPAAPQQPPAVADQQPTSPAPPPASAAVPTQEELAIKLANDPDYFKQRLDRAQQAAVNKLLSDLGATDVESAKAAIAAANAAAEASKSAEQRALEASEKLKSTATQAEQYQQLIKEQAARMMLVLDAEQRKAVEDFAGEDPAQQLKAIQAFAPTWSKQAAEAPKQTPADDQAEAPAANTSPAPGAPGATGPESPPDKRQTYITTRQTNPFAAATFGMRNPRVYETQ